MKTYLLIILALSLVLLDNLQSLSAQQHGVWECLPNDCRIPRKDYSNAKPYELSEDEKFKLKIEKTLAKEPKKFNQFDRQNKSQLETQRSKRRHFSAWAFPIQGN